MKLWLLTFIWFLPCLLLSDSVKIHSSFVFISYSSSQCHHTPLTSNFTRLFKYELPAYDALSPEVIRKIAAPNVFFIVLWHYKLTVAFIKQEMKRGTMNIAIWMTPRIPIISRWHGGHIGLSCAKERALQLSVWWIHIYAVSSWTTQHAGVTESSQSSLYSVSRPELPQYDWMKKDFVGSVEVILALPPFHVGFCSLRHEEISILNPRG